MRTKNHLLQVWLDDKEYNTLLKRSTSAGVSQSAYVRMLLNNLQPRDLPPPDYRLMMRQLYHCGNALNQVARKANALNVIDVQKYDDAFSDYCNTVALIEDSVIAPEQINERGHQINMDVPAGK